MSDEFIETAQTINELTDALARLDVDAKAAREALRKFAIVGLGHKGLNAALHYHSEQAVLALLRGSPALFRQTLGNAGIPGKALLVLLTADLASTKAVCTICGDAIATFQSDDEWGMGAIRAELQPRYAVEPSIQLLFRAVYAREYTTSAEASALLWIWGPTGKAT